MGPAPTAQLSASEGQPTTAPPAPNARAATRRASARAPPSRVLVPVRYSAWLMGDIGTSLERTLRVAIHAALPSRPVRVTRLPRAFILECDEEPGILLEAAHRAALEMERVVTAGYPVLHHQMGPVWTGTLQAVFS